MSVSSKRTKPEDEPLWKWKGIDKPNWNWRKKETKEDSKRSLVAEFLARNERQAEEDLVLGPGVGAGIGCGAGIGIGLIGGAVYGGSPRNHLNLAVGVGVGCGVGIGFGYGQGIGGGFSFDSMNSRL